MNFSFDHPVAVKIFFTCESEPAMETQIKSYRSDQNGELTIPLKGMASGLWNALVEWSYDGRDFCMERKFKIKPEKAQAIKS